VTEKLLTEARIVALNRICRFNGWTARHYSVLEHTVIGAMALMRSGEPVDVIKTFLLHDVEETEFGDIVRPVKRRFMTDGYADAVSVWNNKLFAQEGVPVGLLSDPRIVSMDDGMVVSEFRTIACASRIKANDNYDLHTDHAYIESCIRDGWVFSGDAAIQAFWRLYHGV